MIEDGLENEKDILQLNCAWLGNLEASLAEWQVQENNYIVYRQKTRTLSTYELQKYEKLHTALTLHDRTAPT